MTAGMTTAAEGRTRCAARRAAQRRGLQEEEEEEMERRMRLDGVPGWAAESERACERCLAGVGGRLVGAGCRCVRIDFGEFGEGWWCVYLCDVASECCFQIACRIRLDFTFWKRVCILGLELL